MACSASVAFAEVHLIGRPSNSSAAVWMSRARVFSESENSRDRVDHGPDSRWRRARRLRSEQRQGVQTDLQSRQAGELNLKLRVRKVLRLVPPTSLRES